MIDTHCHLTIDQLHRRVDQVIAAAGEAGVDRMISVGVTPDDAQAAAKLARQYPNVYVTAGLHPHYATADFDEAELQRTLRSMLQDERVVAIGEMGLDWHYDEPTPEIQRHAFAAQLAIAAEFSDLPIIIHNREATDDTLAMIADAKIPGERFVFHCFTGSADELKKILDLGAMVSLTGIVTFGSAGDLATASDAIPLDRLMIETDSPYLTPKPHRKVHPNEPRYVRHVAEFLAERRGMTLDEFTSAVDRNAERFFGLTSNEVKS